MTNGSHIDKDGVPGKASLRQKNGPSCDPAPPSSTLGARKLWAPPLTATCSATRTPQAQSRVRYGFALTSPAHVSGPPARSWRCVRRVPAGDTGADSSTTHVKEELRSVLVLSGSTERPLARDVAWGSSPAMGPRPRPQGPGRLAGGQAPTRRPNHGAEQPSPRYGRPVERGRASCANRSSASWRLCAPASPRP